VKVGVSVGVGVGVAKRLPLQAKTSRLKSESSKIVNLFICID
jgi:hypothetical protein